MFSSLKIHPTLGQEFSSQAGTGNRASSKCALTNYKVTLTFSRMAMT
jgi:hypothetical protein